MRRPAPTESDFQGYEVYGMPSPSSGGLTVGEALLILEQGSWTDTTGFWHLLLESTAHAFADRNAYIGDDRYVYVPATGMLSEDFAAERFAQIEPRPGEHQAGGARRPVRRGRRC